MKSLLAKLKLKLPPLPATPPTHAPHRQTLAQMGVVIALALALHFSIASLVIALFSCAVFAVKCVIIWRNMNNPPQWMVMILTVFSVGLIIFSYGGWNGQTAGISFLVLLVSLKFLESRTVRDYFVVCLILYFLAASSFLFNSSLTNIVLVIGYTIAITGLLFKITNPAQISTIKAGMAASSLILKSIPLALFLFFFFPRVQGSFGFLPTLEDGRNSLDNALIAGEMASSAFSNELAFKAEFLGEIPPTSRLYWRAKVMDEEVDFAWKISDNVDADIVSLNNAREMREQSSKVPAETRYEILHEPTSDVYLPYLDYVASYSKGRLGHDYTIRINQADNRSYSYSGASNLRPWYQASQINNVSLLSTKSRPSARTQALLSKIQQQWTSEGERAEAVFNHFADNEFVYSLTPSALDSDAPLDDFLFDSKTGYCEHYASAFTTLLRWLRIPSRVVVGYQGGNINSTGNFVEVRYSDAHAWSEAYIDGSWVRFDPTAAISPERIEYGMEAIMELWDTNTFGTNASGRALTNFLNPTGTALAWKKLAESWSNVQFQWKKWVVDYDFNTQRELLEKFGIEARNTLHILVIILSSGVFLILGFYFWQLIPKREKRSELQKLYFRFSKKAKGAGIERHVSETPSQLAKRLITKFPLLESQIQSITDQYLALTYGAAPNDMDSEVKSLRKSINKLKL
ncbi:DUF3488 and transglutaminase-like domain-containing protein [Arenicella sp. 4NH20-0111]|uniref:transglutaminase TgpA family protein n=1 Tax=Arenicella sp. 4NH20-0111 TaxID=3127648 RepID=UPI003108C028